ncbi:unnamed protein product [Closterium sp. NIES-65]|nr:unnamed protein product [Closterium sp. NIES-65]
MAGSHPMPADEEEFHDAIHANAMLNAAEDFKPSDYSNIIRRYSHLGATHPSNPLTVAKAGEDEKSAGGKTRRSQSTGGGVKKGKGSSVASTLGRAAARVGRTLGAKGGSLAKSKSSVAPLQSDDEFSKQSEQPSMPIVLQPFMGSYGSELVCPSNGAFVQTKALQEENRRLRERIAMLEAVHAEEADDSDDLARHRVRMLKSSNLQLEHQLLASESASLTAKAIRNELLSAMDHLHRTVGALHVRAGEDEAEGEQAEAEAAEGAGGTEMGNSHAGTLDQTLLPAAAILLDDAQHAAAQEKESASAAAVAVAKGVSKVGAAQQPLTRRNSFGGRGSAALASAARPSTPTSRGTSSFASGSPRATTPRATSSAGKGSASPTVGARRGGATVGAAGSAGKGKTGGGSFNARGWGVGPGKRNGANNKTAEKKTAASGAANDGDGGMDLTSAGSRSASMKDGPLVLDPSIVTSSAVSTPMGTPRAGSTPAGSPFAASAAAATPAPTLGSLLAASGQVAIAKEKLEELAMWSKEAREKVLMLLPAPGGKIGELPAEEGAGKAEDAEAGGGAGGAEKTSMKAMDAPELPCAGNRFMATNEDGDPVAGIAANLCRSIEVPPFVNAFPSLPPPGSAPLLEYARVHELEGRLADLHPRLLALSSLLDNVVFPSLPAETSSAVLQEIRVAIVDVYDTTRALSELAALVPAGAQLFGVGTGESLMLAAAAARAEEGGGGGGGEGEMMEVQQRLEWERERRRREGVSVADLPSVEQLLTAGLAGIVGEGGGMGGGGEGEVQARVAEVVGRCRKVEALWRAEMSGLQEEMGFYRGCHAAQASHVKQIASAAKDALQTVLGDAHEIVSAAATSIQKRRLQILLAVTDFESEPTPEMMQQLAVKVKEEAGTLRRFAELLPQAFSAEAKVAEVLDPLEREFKERMQARRAALARQRNELHGQISGRFANQSGQQGKGKLMRVISLQQ